MFGKELSGVIDRKAEMTMKIRFCENNKGSEKIFKKLKDGYPDVSIKKKDCLKKCGPCGKSLVAVVNGETVKADDGEELYRKLVEMLEKPE